MLRTLGRYSDHAYALLRIITGFLFTFHGMAKILGLFADSQPPVGSQIWIGGLIELLGGLVVMLGLQTRVAAFLCSGTMAVAYIQYHWHFRLGRDFLPFVNDGEMAVLYCFLFLFIACRGGGKWCLDKVD